MERIMNHSLFISHGGGPLPLLAEPSHTGMRDALAKLTTQIPKPRLVIVISAHWLSQEGVAINTQQQPNLLYDYYGFDRAAYDIAYPCTGHTRVANYLAGYLQHQGIPTLIEQQRGLDHGVFVPLKLMYPDADVPCVQISLHGGLDERFHVELGQHLANAVADLDNVLLLGSGFTFHNMAAFKKGPIDDTQGYNRQFEAWLKHTLQAPMSEKQRQQQLIAWRTAPGALYCQPTSEHLLPLHCAYGAACCRPDTHISTEIMGWQASFLLWQLEA
ncbi:hypothetical protein W04_3111 [Pseudoalteromonas sp. SW0106-04]|nr:hypothetical protein W04_3111 [Pseudoalteromonas sp. SW0106-04]